MPFNINDIKQQLRFGGARSNLFEVTIFMKGNGAAAATEKTRFMCEAASMPASNLGTAQIFYFGRALKLSGDRSFDPWQVTVINDEDFLVRNALESWSNEINLLVGNRKRLDNYKSNATVTQFGKTGNPLRTYKLEGLWPSSVSSIELGWDQNDTVQRFSVQFEYDYFTIEGATGAINGN